MTIITKLAFDKETGLEIIFGDSDEYRIVSDTISHQNRWSTYHDIIVKKESITLHGEPTFYKVQIEKGSTEYQETQWPDSFIFTRVWPKEKIIIVYEENP